MTFNPPPSSPSITDTIQNHHEKENHNHSPTTIPQIQRQIPQELHVADLRVDGRAQSPRVFRHKVTEDDAAHGALARARLAHQQHFLLLLLAQLLVGSGRGVHGWRWVLAGL